MVGNITFHRRAIIVRIWTNEFTIHGRAGGFNSTAYFIDWGWIRSVDSPLLLHENRRLHDWTPCRSLSFMINYRNEWRGNITDACGTWPGRGGQVWTRHGSRLAAVPALIAFLFDALNYLLVRRLQNSIGCCYIHTPNTLPTDTGCWGSMDYIYIRHRLRHRRSESL